MGQDTPEFEYQQSDARLDLRDGNEGFELLQLAHEGNTEALYKKGAYEIIAQLLVLLRTRDLGIELRSGTKRGGPLIAAHLRDYITQTQSDKMGDWHKPFLAFLQECGFRDAEVRAVLNTQFAWDSVARTNMDIAARSIGIPPIFAGYSQHEAGGK